MQHQLKRWSEGKRVFRQQAYGTLETLEDALSAQFTYGSRPIDKHLRLLREQYQQTKDKLLQLDVLMVNNPSIAIEPSFQLLQKELQHKVDLMQIMYFAFNEALVSSQLAYELSGQLPRREVAVIEDLTQENQAAAAEIEELKRQLGVAKEKSIFLNYRVRLLAQELEVSKTKHACGSVSLPVDDKRAGQELDLADADNDHQVSSMHNHKRMRIEEGGALAHSDHFT